MNNHEMIGIELVEYLLIINKLIFIRIFKILDYRLILLETILTRFKYKKISITINSINENIIKRYGINIFHLEINFQKIIRL